MGARRSPIVRPLGVPPEALLRLAAQSPDRYPVFLDSAAEGPLSRASLLFAATGPSLWLQNDGRLVGNGMVPSGATFLGALEAWWRAEQDPGPAVAEDLPFLGGWALFLGYEIAQEVEPRLSLPRSPLPWSAFAIRSACALIHDKLSGQVFAVAEAGAVEAAARVEADVRKAAEGHRPLNAPIVPRHVREEEPEAYLGRVMRAKEYVRAGDIYQANLSRPWTVELSHEPGIEALYNRLRHANPAPFASLAQVHGVRILSSSPERLARIAGDRIDTRPIAGTRPRSLRPGGDRIEMQELAAHPKERAEHIMLIDLERNDLGRVCQAGTVHVDELMTIESYAHVHHIVSNVTGRLRPDVTPIGALRAVFPGGTITGCPKFRCMQIIAELEGEGRGAYTGSLGYLGLDGRLDMNILIRTMTLAGRTVQWRAGGGIVADSDPERELEETRAKARGMLATFDLSGGGSS